MIYIDIPNELIFGFNPPSILHPQARRLKIKDLRTVDTHNKYLHTECIKENLYERYNNLYNRMSSSLTTDKAVEYEELDSILVKLMVIAKSKCRKLNMGTIE